MRINTERVACGPVSLPDCLKLTSGILGNEVAYHETLDLIRPRIYSYMEQLQIRAFKTALLNLLCRARSAAHYHSGGHRF